MKKILIIEDEPTLGEVLQKKFEAAGFEVSLIRQSLETLNFIKKTKPDIILLDLFMPILNGFEILKYKKLDPEISDIPVIVMTNSLQSTQEVEIKPLGVARFLIKANLTPKDIVDEVNNIFSTLKQGGVVKEENIKTNILDGKNILLVEDDKFLSSILVSRVESFQGKIIHVNSGEDALKELEKNIPDIILLDILLPGIDGFEVLKSVREDERTKKTPVIVISNFNQRKDIDRAAEFGASFLVKALITPDYIVENIKKVLSEKIK